MGKLVAIETFARFSALWDEHKISNLSLYFIQDTGQLYAHGIWLNSVTFGAEANGSIPVTVAGVSYQLASSSHTHQNYLEKNSNIDIGAYKIVSGQADLFYVNNNKVIVGNSGLPMQLEASTALKTYRDSTEYILLDTGNFSVEAKYSNGVSANNAATIKYGSNSFTIDYIKRVNTSSTFDSLISYTCAGTTLVDSTRYGFMTFYTDGTASQNASWAQMRINVGTKALEIRTSASTTWSGIPFGSSKNLKVNNTNYGLLTNENSLPTIWAPTALGSGGQYLTTSDDGNSLSWRSNPNSWRSISIKNSENTELASLGNAPTTGGITLKEGNNVTFTYNNGVLTIASSFTNTWVQNALDTAGYVAAPTSSDGNKVWKTDENGNPAWREDANSNTWRNIRINDETTDTIGTGINTGALVIKGTGATTVSWTDNKIIINSTNTWNAADFTHAGYVPNSVKGKFLHANASTGDLEWIDDNNTWKAADTSQEGYAPKLQLASTDTISAQTTEYVLTYISGTETAPVWRKLPANAFLNTWTQFVGATANSNGTAGYLPAPGSTHKDDFLRGDGTWQTLGSAAFTASDSTTTLSRAEGNLTKDTWSDVGTFGSGVANGTYVVSFTVDGTLYSGLFSYKSGDTQSEEINLHAAGTSTRRIYARTTGSKFQIVTDADTFNMTATTFNFRKLL